MRVELQCPESAKSSEKLTLRAILFNDSYEAITISRNGFVGPNVQSLNAGSGLNPESVEPTFGQTEETLVLHPFSFYGRERTFDQLQHGDLEVTAYYRNSTGEIETTISQRLRVEQS
jgi:hypothetical protein